MPLANPGAPRDATYITQTPHADLSAEQALNTLSSGLAFVTNGTGVVSSVVPGTGVITALGQNVTGSGGIALADSPVFVHDIDLGSAGVRLTGAAGVLTLTGLGAGADESLTIDLNTNPNFISLSSGSGATTIEWTGRVVAGSGSSVVANIAVPASLDATSNYFVSHYSGPDDIEVITFEAETYLTGAANLTYLLGIQGNSYNSGTGTIADQYGVGGYNEVLSTSTVTLLSALRAFAPTISGGPTVTVNAGITIDAMQGTGGVVDYQIYSLGSALSLFAGPIQATGFVLSNGAALKTTTTTAHTGLLQAYDVDGTAYKTFGTLTNGNTPDFTIAPPSGGTVTLQASTYKSSDGSTGATGTVAGSTVKNGLVTAIASNTHQVSMMGGGLAPDSSGNIWQDLFSRLATNDVWPFAVFNFGGTIANNTAPTTRIGLYGNLQIPQNLNTSGTVKIIPVWSSSLTSGDVVWDFDYRVVGGNDTTSLDQSGTQESVSVTDTAPGAAWRRLIPELAPTTSNFTPGATLEFGLFRDGTDGNDTLAGTAVLIDLIFQYTD